LISYLASEVGEEAAHEMVRWIKEAVSPAELAVVYAEHDCLLAPPWLDGLNLTIFEFIMTQLSLNGGVVAVSLLTGARAVLRGVIDLTPGDVARMAIAIKNCFDDIGSRRAQGRMQVMMNSVPSLAQWWQDFKALAL
jgi:trehalose-6-phosphate synthase